MTTDDKVAVSQEARDLFKTVYHYDDPDGERYVDEGRFDALPRMQRIARFEAQVRLACKREERERCAKVAETRFDRPDMSSDYRAAGNAIATAIREQRP